MSGCEEAAISCVTRKIMSLSLVRSVNFFPLYVYTKQETLS